MKRPGCRAVALLFLLLAPVGSAGVADEMENPAVRIQQWLDSWDDLQGRFQQVLSSPTLPSSQIEEGSFQVARPDRMRWDYSRPEKKLAVTDGTHTWLYIPADRQVIRGRLDRMREDSAASLLLSGSLRLEEAFVVEAAFPAVEAEGKIELQLVPRRPSETISRIELRAEASTGRVLGFTVTDQAANRVSYHFSHLEENAGVAPERFTFRIPRGVEIQDLEESAAPEHAP